MYYKHLKSVFTKFKCGRLLEEANKLIFVKAPVNYNGDTEIKSNIRNNERTEFDHSILAHDIGCKLVCHALDSFPNKINRFDFTKVGSHFRLYKYSEGQFFKPHKDGHVLDGELESQVTVLIYLNDVESGGETVLMPNGFSDKESHITIQPKAGDVLMFEHGMWHEGRPVVSGYKYVLRTDLFYSFDMFAK